MDLFEHSRQEQIRSEAPLAARMRPRTLDEFVGQEHIVGEGRLLRRAIAADRLFSSILLWGPPGTGKTTLAMVIANMTESHFEILSAVLDGKPRLREVVDQATERRRLYNTRTILFVDEVHRWNKAQQDALLPHVENGTLTLIEQEGWVVTGAYGGAGSILGGPAKDLYTCPNVRTVVCAYRANTDAGRAFRAPGYVEGTVALEGAMDEIERLAQVFKALSDPTRLRLVKLLSGNAPGAHPGEVCSGGGFLCVNAQAHKLGVTQSAVSQHLRVLRQAGLALHGYSEEPVSRPSADLDWLGIKVIRPQDMPLQVANGNFDLAITGEDWLREHLYRFPSSPVKKLLALGFGTVKVVAAVSQDMPADSIDDLRLLVQSGKFAPPKVASEYINVADRYIRDNRVHPYRLIPTWGASEAFLPEDADMLVDNTQTGKTLKQHKLKILDVLFQSSACLIANRNSLASSRKKEKIKSLTERMRAGLL